MRSIFVWALLALMSFAVSAHETSNAFLQLERNSESTVKLTIDVSLQDLNTVLPVDKNDDSSITFGEVKTARNSIAAYVGARLLLNEGACRLGAPRHALVSRDAKAFERLVFDITCQSTTVKLAYSLFKDVDPTHKGLLNDNGKVLLLAPGGTTEVALNLTKNPESLLPMSLASAGPLASEPGSLNNETPSSTSTSIMQNFFIEGIHHILIGYDHILFLIVLLLPVLLYKNKDNLIMTKTEVAISVAKTVTMFTVAHSVTLALATLGIVKISPTFIEIVIALSIVLTAIDNWKKILPGSRNAVVFGFGLIHGFGFANVLAELNLPADTLGWALLQFNLGVEAGQLGIIALALMGLFLIRQKENAYRKYVLNTGSFAVGLFALGWVVERSLGLEFMPI